MNAIARGARAPYFVAMFTGLIEEIAIVQWIRATERGTQLQLTAPRVAAGIRRGDSVAVNGCCLTVTSYRDDKIAFDLLEETLQRTNLRDLRPDATVNLERSLAADARLGGHFVQGHIDCAVRIVAVDDANGDTRIKIELPTDFAHYVAFKGSVAVNGISLTVAEVLDRSFVVYVIPHTRRHTNLQHAQPNDRVNLEFDILAKYVERMLARISPA